MDSFHEIPGRKPPLLQPAPRARPLPRPRRRIGELLILEGLITRAQLGQALIKQAENGGRIVGQLIALGHITSHEFVSFVARQPGVTSIDLKHCRIPDELAALIPRDFALERQVCPIDKMGHSLTVGMVCPIDQGTVDELRHITGLSIMPMLCTAESIIATIHRCYPDEGPSLGSLRHRRKRQRLQWIR